MACFSKMDVGGCGCGVSCGPGSPCTLPATNLHVTLSNGTNTGSGTLTYSLVGSQCQWVSGCVTILNATGSYNISIFSDTSCFAVIVSFTSIFSNCRSPVVLARYEVPATCHDGAASNMTLSPGWTCSPLSVAWTFSNGGTTITMTVTP